MVVTGFAAFDERIRLRGGKWLVRDLLVLNESLWRSTLGSCGKGANHESKLE